MLSSELEMTMRRLQETWPKWKPTQAQREAWMMMLKNEDYNIARQAIQSAFRSSRYSTPRAGDVSQHLRRLSEPAAGRDKDSPLHALFTLVHVGGSRCKGLAADEAFAGRRGLAQDETERIAERCRQRVQEVYDGKWEIHYGNDRQRILERRAELLVTSRMENEQEKRCESGKPKEGKETSQGDQVSQKESGKTCIPQGPCPF